MAATIAVSIGRGLGYETKGSRLGDLQSEAQANTRSTFATAIMNADGSGEVRIERLIDGTRTQLALISFGAEEGADAGRVEFRVKDGHVAARTE
jgi:hypothetical protein